MKPRPPKPVKRSPAVISANAVYSWSELCRRFGWEEHAARQARVNGLRLVRFGRGKYALGSDVLKFFKRLAERQAQAQEGKERLPYLETGKARDKLVENLPQASHGKAHCCGRCKTT
jgi:hypothetical protein